MTARISGVIGRHWGGMVRLLDILYALAAFGALGGLPPLLNMVAKYARDAMTSLHGPPPRVDAACAKHRRDTSVPPGEVRFPALEIHVRAPPIQGLRELPRRDRVPSHLATRALTRDGARPGSPAP